MYNNYSSYYYKRKNKKNKAYLSVIITCVILLVAFIGLIIFSSNLNSSDKYSTNFDVNCYLISIGSFEDLSSATIFAETVRIKNGAGYIYKNKGYNVIVSIYFEDKQAKTVLNTLLEKGETAKILTVSLKDIVHGYLENSEKERLQSSISNLKKAINTIYDLSNGFDTGALSNREVKQSLKAINEEIISEYEKNIEFSAFKSSKLENFNNTLYKIAISINESMLSNNLEAKDLRFLNIDMCIMLFNI
jgi:hypothetical protein